MFCASTSYRDRPWHLQGPYRWQIASVSCLATSLGWSLWLGLDKSSGILGMAGWVWGIKIQLALTGLISENPLNRGNLMSIDPGCTTSHLLLSGRTERPKWSEIESPSNSKKSWNSELGWVGNTFFRRGGSETTLWRAPMSGHHRNLCARGCWSMLKGVKVKGWSHLCMPWQLDLVTSFDRNGLYEVNFLRIWILANSIKFF